MDRRKRWNELSQGQQRRPGEQIRGSKKLWTAAAFVNFVGPLAYFAFGRRPT
jgi:hypothetical protein